MKKFTIILIIIGFLPIFIWLCIDFSGTLIDLIFAYFILCVVLTLLSPLLFGISIYIWKKDDIKFKKSKKYLSNNYCNMGVAEDLSCIKIFEKNKNPRRILTIYTYRSEAPKIWNLFCSIYNEKTNFDFWKNFCLQKQIKSKETFENRTRETDDNQLRFFNERNIDI